MIEDAIYSYDPLPPVDSIVSYQRPEPKTPTGTGSGQSFFGLFLRSWMPDFNVQEQLQQAAEAAQRGDEPTAATSEGTTLRQSITSLMDAMRDLLNNVGLGEESQDEDEFDEAVENEQ